MAVNKYIVYLMRCTQKTRIKTDRLVMSQNVIGGLAVFNNLLTNNVYRTGRAFTVQAEDYEVDLFSTTKTNNAIRCLIQDPISLHANSIIYVIETLTFRRCMY